MRLTNKYTKYLCLAVSGNNDVTKPGIHLVLYILTSFGYQQSEHELHSPFGKKRYRCFRP